MLQAFLSLWKKHRLKVHLKETGLKVVDGIHLTFYWDEREHDIAASVYIMLKLSSYIV